MNCANIDDSWGMDNESFYLCSSNEKVQQQSAKVQQQTQIV